MGVPRAWCWAVPSSRLECRGESRVCDGYRRQGPSAGTAIPPPLLTGKYGRDKIAAADGAGNLPNRAGETRKGGSDGRLNGDNPFGGMLFTGANFHAVDELRAVAEEVGRSMDEVALAWAVGRPGVSSVLIGASRPEQVRRTLPRSK
jgi:aryl-alcohol dehydrogenase-like predicted oxidoreductase